MPCRHDLPASAPHPVQQLVPKERAFIKNVHSLRVEMYQPVNAYP